MSTYLSTDQIEMARQLVAQNNKLEGLVISAGSLDPKFVLVAEAPGSKEIETGLPFMGPSGQELNKWLDYLEITRADIYFTKTVFARPFNLKAGRKSDRKPTNTEMKAFAPLLDAELIHFTDRLIVPVGGTALTRLLGKQSTITNLHGQLITTPIQRLDPVTNKYELTTQAYQLFPLFHPSYIRRFPSKRDLAYQDLNTLKQLLKL
ncbi:uracil-DNA glycosylase [Lentilactobacillus senioris]|uniref:uracil-DNA glycosylase n=1 Tax=Lentilactobacillus senioris TaxID=931534 RepID=UPI0022817C4C|nr:uracil-DNA glycosylase [Lentilactobacillus senioris]MCY9807407.1 uracil-DNA glycosylase [Lentilactobacillus senioris]